MIPDCTHCGCPDVTFEGREYDITTLEAFREFRCRSCGGRVTETEEPTDRHDRLHHAEDFASRALAHDGFAPLTSEQTRALWWGPKADAVGMLEDFIDRVLNSDDAKMAMEHAITLLLDGRAGEP